MSTKKSSRVITKNSTMFKNNKATFTGAVKKAINNYVGSVNEAQIVADLQAKYPNMYIDSAMVGKVCNELMTSKFFQGSNSSAGITTYSLYNQGNVKTTVACKTKPATSTGQTLVAPNTVKTVTSLDAQISKDPSLKTTLEPVLHESTTKSTNKYELITNLNVMHLRNICKKELKKWDCKTQSFEQFTSTNKYYKELISRESLKK